MTSAQLRNILKDSTMTPAMKSRMEEMLSPSPVKKTQAVLIRIDPLSTRTEIVIDGLKLESEANKHEYHMLRQRRAKKQHQSVALHMLGKWFPPLSIRCTIVRIAPRSLDDDNLQMSGKFVRDAVAKAYGVNDREPCIQWLVVQEKSKAGVYGVRILLEAK